MLKFTKRMSSAYFGVILIFLLFQNSFGQTPNKDILDKEINLEIKKGTLYQVYAQLGSLEGIPTGFEGTTDFDFREGKIIQIENGTLRKILDSIVKQEPNYTWEVRDGVVNVYPIRSRDEILKNLLETKIKSFSSRKEMGRIQIGENIKSLEEIKMLLDSKQIRLGTFTRTSLYVEDATTDIDISNTDLRGVLNKVVYDSGDSKLWTINRTKDQGIFLAF